LLWDAQPPADQCGWSLLKPFSGIIRQKHLQLCLGSEYLLDKRSPPYTPDRPTPPHDFEAQEKLISRHNLAPKFAAINPRKERNLVPRHFI
jgi:hypothetical protein